jgi:hypothetical protein
VAQLHHADEDIAKELIVIATGTAESLSDEMANVSAASGWFREEATRVATPEDIKAIQANMGGEDALRPPSHWDVMQDPSVAKRFEIKPGTPEYDTVSQDFLSTLNKRKKNVKKIERVQNLAMWQSYVVKRQAICLREIGHSSDEAKLHNAEQRYERERLWHGSNVEVVEKILQQGFNRSFCGKHGESKKRQGELWANIFVCVLAASDTDVCLFFASFFQPPLLGKAFTTHAIRPIRLVQHIRFRIKTAFST